MTSAPSLPGALPAFTASPSVAAPLSSVQLNPRQTVTHAPYRREPYVRFRTPTSVIDGKAAAWTRVSVLLHWIDDSGQANNRWVPAENVRRVPRDESSWQDPYDDWSFYYPEASAGSSVQRLSTERLSTAA